MTDIVVSVHAFDGELWSPVEEVHAPSLKLAQDTAILRAMSRAQNQTPSKPLGFALIAESQSSLGEKAAMVAYLDAGGVPLEDCPPSIPEIKVHASPAHE